ncbi:uncharacterized protein B0H64DRAFT_474136 [Chaetomium fimeti]|uniref:Uncharacterized protein n=1 Tax=Chaetomium fimeti TaxID=1854472 RepID=A0AAE0HER7_9PEZI|nr:hypothetical protein B0H64DRAFT_474136 [Chaetomium fimeti]
MMRKMWPATNIVSRDGPIHTVMCLSEGVVSRTPLPGSLRVYSLPCTPLRMMMNGNRQSLAVLAALICGIPILRRREHDPDRLHRGTFADIKGRDEKAAPTVAAAMTKAGEGATMKAVQIMLAAAKNRDATDKTAKDYYDLPVIIKSFILSLPHKDFKWARVCVDEAQSMRKMCGSNSRIIRLLEANALHMMTATPALNKIEDVKSFGSLA